MTGEIATDLLFIQPPPYRGAAVHNARYAALVEIRTSSNFKCDFRHIAP